MGIGQLVYKIFFKPTLPIRYHLRHFGIAGWYKLRRGEQQMKKAATHITPIALTDDHLLEVSYLTGAKYWHQTIFCAYSLAKILNGRIKVNIYSDGTLSDMQGQYIKKALPNTQLVNPEEISTLIDELLPEKTFPLLRSLREQNPFLRKLIDMRINRRYIIQLDSDMLFFNRPDELIDAYRTDNNYFMQDTIPASSYVLPEDLISKKLNIPIREKINSGILAYDSAKIDWHFVEQTCAYLVQTVQSVHLPTLEQTLNAIIISQLNGAPLKPAYHILYDSDTQEMHPSDIVRHYIFKAKLPYFTSEWKKILH